MDRGVLTLPVGTHTYARISYILLYIDQNILEINENKNTHTHTHTYANIHVIHVYTGVQLFYSIHSKT